MAFTFLQLLGIKLRLNNHFSYLLLISILLIWPLFASSATPLEDPIPGANVASIRTWLYQHNPQLRALQAETEAAEARVQPAGALPNPMFSVEFLGINASQPSMAPGNDDTSIYRVRQGFPLWGKRELSRDVERNKAKAYGLDRDAVALDLLARAEDSYVRYWYIGEAEAIINRQISLVEQIQEIASTRYALGLAAQQDSIRAQVERTVMQRELIERRTLRREAVAELNAVLGRRVDASLATPISQPDLAVSSNNLATSLESLEHGVHPGIQASLTMATAASRNVELVKRNRYPDVYLTVGAMQQNTNIESYEVMLEVEIPFQQRALRERERESRLLEESALARASQEQLDLQGRLGMAWSRWNGAKEQRELIENTLLPQADANYKSALASYQVSKVDFGTLLAALTEWQGADLARIDATRDELLGAVAVRAIIGDSK